MTYEFKYSISNSNGIFYYLFIFLGFFIAIFINYLILKFFNKPILLTLDKVIHGEYKHSVLAFLLLFIVPFIFLYGIFPCFIAGLMINKVMYKNGSIDILNNYAILHYKNEEIILEKEKFSIEAIERKNIYLLNTKFMLMRLGKEEIYLYVIKTDNGKKYKLYKQTKGYFKSVYAKCTNDTSLPIAMQKLSKISNIKKGK